MSDTDRGRYLSEEQLDAARESGEKLSGGHLDAVARVQRALIDAFPGDTEIDELTGAIIDGVAGNKSSQ